MVDVHSRHCILLESVVSWLRVSYWGCEQIRLVLNYKSSLLDIHKTVVTGEAVNLIRPVPSETALLGKRCIAKGYHSKKSRGKRPSILTLLTLPTQFSSSLPLLPFVILLHGPHSLLRIPTLSALVHPLSARPF